MTHQRMPVRPAIDARQIGREGEPLVIIDHFHPDPALLRNQAAEATFLPMGEFYPGPRAPVPESYFAAIAPVVAITMQRAFGYANAAAFERGMFSLVTSAPADLALPQRIPHVDSVAEGKIAIVHYLSEENFGGTAFFRHRSTGFETIDQARHAHYLAMLEQDFMQHGEPQPGYIDGSTDIFEQIASVDARFNRAVIYRSNLLHCADTARNSGFSADPLAGRLTIASFLAVR